MSDYILLYNRTLHIKDHQSDHWMNAVSAVHNEASRINHKIGYKGPSWHGHEHHDEALRFAQLVSGGLALHDIATKIRRNRTLAEAKRVNTAFQREAEII